MRRLGAVVAFVVAGCGLLSGGSNVVDGWAFPTAAPLPSGAQPAPIDVQALPGNVPAEAVGCPLALLPGVELVVNRSVTPPAVGYRLTASGAPTNVIWSWGVSARDVGGKVEIVGPDGTLLMQEGAAPVDLTGRNISENEFQACLFTSLPTRATAAPPS